jgi:alpha-D-xyloside xylohydrolase
MPCNLALRCAVALVLALLSCGCDDDDSSRKPLALTATPTASPSTSPTASPTPTPTTSPTPTVPQNPILGGELSVAFADGVLTLRRDEQTLQTWPLDAFQLGLVDVLEEAQNYDPYPIVANIPLLRRPRNLRWVAANAAQVSRADADSFTLALAFPENKTAALAIVQRAAGRFEARFVPQAGDPPVAFFRLRPRVDPSEAFYGLGEYFDAVNHRGRIRAMQLEVDSGIESFNNEAHVPIPFVIGTRGWGLFVESPYPAAFDVAAADDDVVEATFGTAFASLDGLLFHLFAAQHPLDVTKHYYDVTGYPTLPARWALGPWIWRDENRDQAQVENDLATIRDLDLATTAIWIDRPYASGVNSFDFKPSQFPDPPHMIQLAHDLGFRMALWHTPYVDRDDPATRELLQEANQGGYLPLRTGLALNDWGVPLDFTDPQAFSWWQDLIRRYTDMGIEGFKLDYGEDVVPGLAGTRTIWEFEDGSDERTMHGRYQLFYHRVYAELLPSDGSFLLCRHATYGGQRYASVIWPGDLDADMSKHRETVVDDGETYVAVGGLPASLIAGLSLGPSGFPFYGSDTGGYRHSPPDKETFTRWFEQTALSSVMQVGTSSSDVPWEFNEENGFDDEMLDWYREYARLHLRLFPYEWTHAQRLLNDGRPIQRALGLAYPEVGAHPDDTYLFGDDLLVAPVVERGERQRQVILPPGTWYDWWTGTAHEGDRTITVDAPLGVLPLFLRGGGIVPLLRPTIDTISPTTDPQRVDSYATSPGILYVRVGRGPDSAFEIFDGATVAQRSAGNALELSWADGEEFRYGAVFEITGVEEQIELVTDNGEPLARLASREELEAASSGWSDEGNGQAVKVPGGVHQVRLTYSSAPVERDR